MRGRISVAGAAGSAAKSALAIAVRYGDRRRQFERPGRDGAPAEEVPVLDYLAHQRRLLPALAQTYALHFAQAELVASLHDLQAGRLDAVAGAAPARPAELGEEDSQRQRELEARAAGLKAVARWHATATIQTCREACGGAGYLAANRLPQLKADSDVFTTFEGDDTVLLQLVAKGLPTSYRDHVGRRAPAPPGRAAATRSRSSTPPSRTCSPWPGRTSTGSCWRPSWPPSSVAGTTATTATTATTRASPGCSTPSATSTRSRRSRPSAPGTWEHGRLTPGRAKAVTRAVDELCGELRPHAVTLVDAFAIPDAWLAAEPVASPGR